MRKIVWPAFSIFMKNIFKTDSEHLNVLFYTMEEQRKKFKTFTFSSGAAPVFASKIHVIANDVTTTIWPWKRENASLFALLFAMVCRQSGEWRLFAYLVACIFALALAFALVCFAIKAFKCEPSRREN